MSSVTLLESVVRLLARGDVSVNAHVFSEMLARGIGWDAAELWVADRQAVLRMRAAWYWDEEAATTVRAIGEKLASSAGHGLPGKAADSGIVVWVDTTDVATLVRGPALAEASLTSAMAIPMRTARRVEGALLFFNRSAAKIEQQAIDQLSDVAALLASSLESERVRTELQETSTKLKLVLEETDSVAWSANADLEVMTVEAPAIASRAQTDRILAYWTTVVRASDELLGVHRAALANGPARFTTEFQGRAWSARLEPVPTDRARLVAGVARDQTAERKRAERLRSIADALLGSEALFDRLARELAAALGTDMAFVLVAEGNERGVILGGTDRGGPFPRLSCDVLHAPSADTMRKRETLVCPAGVGTRWSSSTLAELGVESFAGHPLIDAAGQVVGVIAAMSRTATTLDHEGESLLRIVAARAAAEIDRLRDLETLAAAEQRHRAVAETIDDALITIDHEGTIEYANAAASRIFGYSREELVGANVSLLMGDPHASDHHTYIRRYLATGASRVIGAGRDVTGRRKDGAELQLRLTLHETHLPSRRLFTGVLRDLTESIDTRKALQRARSMLAETERVTRVGNWVWHLDTNALEWSDEIFRIFGRERATFATTYRSFMKCVHPDDRQKVEQAAAEALLRGRASVEHRIVRPDLSEAIVREQGEVQYEGEKAVRVVGTVQDVTERQRAHDRLWKFSSAIEQTADQVMITNRDGLIEYVNPAFERVSGYSRAALLGQTPRVLRSGAHTLAFYKQVWTTLLSGDVYRGVFINRRSDGALVYEDKTITPIRNAGGEITHFVSTGRDITDRRRAEQEQEELRLAVELSAYEWRMTFDAIEFPIFVCGKGGDVHRANVAAQKLSGLPFDALIGRKLEELPRCQPWTGAAELLPRAIAGESASIQVEEPVARMTWELAAMPFSRDAAVQLVIFIARDLTAVMRLQESLRRTEVMSTLGTLVAGVAHEVRNPLFAISATIDAFEGRSLERSAFDQFTARLRSELQRLSELMHDLLEYGRPTGIEARPGSVRGPVEQALRATAVLAASAGVIVEANLESGGAAVLLDEARLHIALANLLDNAIRHTGRGGRVGLDVIEKADHVEVVIRDSGPGFAESDIPRLFEPFFTRRRGGTGLGLSIVHRTVEQHGGTVVAENDPDGGAVMRVRIPYAEEQS